MAQVYPCLHPFCNNRMLMEGYTSSVFWRISAIFAVIAALFSVGVVLWYLIFRDNPNMPDETDPEEIDRFHTEIDREKHNLFSEIVAQFKNFPSMNASLKSKMNQKPNGPNFFHRLAYLAFGTQSDEYEDVNLGKSSKKKKDKAKKKSKNKNNSAQVVDKRRRVR